MRFDLNTDPIEAMVKMSGGNPGAATVLGRIFQMCGPGKTMILMGHLDDKDIVGSLIWCAFKDVCKQNIHLLIQKIPQRSKFVEECMKVEGFKREYDYVKKLEKEKA